MYVGWTLDNFKKSEAEQRYVSCFLNKISSKDYPFIFTPPFGNPLNVR